MQQDSPLVRMENIVKRFSSIEALKGVSFEVGHQEIVGLLGDNGAGKSTLIKILSGIFPQDEGEIYFNGRLERFSSPQEARAKGIETVHQNLSLVNMMTISRNFFLGREPCKRRGPLARLDKNKMDNECRKILADVGVQVRSLDEYVSILSGGERQAISIGRAMYWGAKLLILDEPMTALSVKEQKKILEHIRATKEAGASVIFITHNVYQVYPIASRFTVLDKGTLVGTFAPREVTVEQLVEIVAKGRI